MTVETEEGRDVMSRAGFSERVGTWSVRHRRLAILAWVAFVVIAVGSGVVVGQRMLDDSQSGSGETARAERILARAGFPDRASEAVLVESGRPGTSWSRARRTARSTTTTGSPRGSARTASRR